MFPPYGLFLVVVAWQTRKLLLDPAIHEEFSRLKVCFSLPIYVWSNGCLLSLHNFFCYHFWDPLSMRTMIFIWIYRCIFNMLDTPKKNESCKLPKKAIYLVNNSETTTFQIWLFLKSPLGYWILFTKETIFFSTISSLNFTNCWINLPRVSNAHALHLLSWIIFAWYYRNWAFPVFFFLINHS